MFAFALIVGISLFFAGLAAIGWACVTFIKELFGCMDSDNDEEDDSSENDDNDVE